MWYVNISLTKLCKAKKVNYICVTKGVKRWV